MTFDNATELLNYLQFDGDLYSPEAEIYAFEYNDRGAIAYYRLPKDRAWEIAVEAKESQEYWGAFLGVGGYIIEPDDDNYEWFTDPSGTVIEDWLQYDWGDTELWG